MSSVDTCKCNEMNHKGNVEYKYCKYIMYMVENNI
jgi:hypothetical protein